MTCVADIDDRAPFREFGAKPAIFDKPLAQAVEPLGDNFAGAEGLGLGAFIYFYSGDRAGLFDQLDQRRAILGILPDRFVIKDDAGRSAA
jgi:hypothetical protein